MRRLYGVLATFLIVLATGSGSLAFATQTDANSQKPLADSPLTVEVPPPSDSAVRYYRTGNAWWCFNLLWSLAVPGLILTTGLSRRLRDRAENLTRGQWYLALLAYFGAYISIVGLVDLPRSYWLGFVRPHAYGLSNQLFSKWALDMSKGFGIGLVAAALFLWLPYLLIRKSPQRWWLYTTLLSVPLSLFLVFVSPIWVAPLFNDFGPMQDRQLEARILTMAQRTGVEFDRVFEVDKSVDTRRVNAYVTGFAGTKRIVLWDTLLERLDEDQVVFVMGHELGHYVLGHLTRSLLLLSAVTLLTLYGVHRVGSLLIGRIGPRFGLRGLSDPAALPLLLILLDLFGLLFAPASLAWSRYQEREADRFALELTQDNQAGASAFVALQTNNLSYPYPGTLYKVLRASHPPIGERVRFCNEYRPWESGQSLRYGGRFTR